MDIKKYIAVVFLTALATMPNLGCSFTGGPRARLGYLPTDTLGVPFPDPNKLGKHSYGFNPFSEASGILYTCKGGHIDIDHVRGNADVTRYLYNQLQKTLKKGSDSFSFSLTGETSSHIITLTYPNNWKNFPNKRAVIKEIAIDTAPHLAFSATTWHEILTWFGVSFIAIEPEFYSAFSWEDSYSNLIGTIVAVRALKYTDLDFDKAVTIEFYKILDELGVQPKEVARRASANIKGTWYKGEFFTDTYMRNFDIGLDGSITPTLLPGIGECDDPPLALPVASLETLKHYGLTLTHEIKPYVLEQGRIFNAAGSKTIYVEEHYPVLIDYMKSEARQKGFMFDQ